MPLLIDKKTTLLIDLSGYIFRAYHAIHELTTKAGLPTNAIYGVTRMLARLLHDYPDTNMVAVKDASGPSWRHEVFPEYKANRSATPEDLKVQFDKVYAVVEAIGIPSIELAGHEADDLIASVARHLSRQKKPVVILSADKDLLQLVDDNITMWDPMRDSLYDADSVFEKWGVDPDQMADLLALMGDSSDNVPGVAGIGKKRARDLIDEFGSLDNLLNSLDKLPEQKWANALRENPENAELSYRLVVLPDKLPEEIEVNKLQRSKPDLEKMKALFQEFEFFKLLEQLAEVFPSLEDSSVPVETALIQDPLENTIYEALTDVRLIQELLVSSPAAFDTETTSLNPRLAQLVGVSAAISTERGYYIPLRHQTGVNIELEDFFSVFKTWAEDGTLHKWGQNLKYDAGVLLNAGIELMGIQGDSMIASYLLNPDGRGHGLDALAERELAHSTLKFSEVAQLGDFRLVDVEQATEYAGEDATVAFALCERLHHRLKEQELWGLYTTMELPLIPVLASMEWWGIRVDTSILGKMKLELQAKVTTIEAEIMQQFKRAINLQSPKQIGELLFDELGLPTKGVRKTKTGAWSTDVSVLENLKNEHIVVEKILEHRTYSKLLQTYVTGLTDAVLQESGRIHPKFHQAVAATGRLACTDPNLQNIPVRDEWGRRIRSAFIPEDGFVFIGADYSQIELRVLAHIARDPGLLEAFQNGQDIHSRTASEILGRPLESVSTEDRRIAKTINFGLMYGMGAQRLAKSVNISQAEAKEYIEAYFARFPKVLEFKEHTIAAARKDEFVTTLFGRKRWLREINSGNKKLELQAERIAVNTPIQGTAADIMKLAMIAVFNRLKKDAPEARMLLQVHDELLVECPEAIRVDVQKMIVEEMEDAATLAVPLTVDSSIGKHWDEAH